jgi:hypothetical protein
MRLPSRMKTRWWMILAVTAALNLAVFVRGPLSLAIAALTLSVAALGTIIVVNRQGNDRPDRMGGNQNGVTNTSTAIEGSIKALVRAWHDGPDPHDLGPVVRETGAIPVYSDMGGTLFIRPDGEILLLCHDSDEPPQIEPDPHWRLWAKVAGAEKYPELRVLLPIRDENATECRSCCGRGRVLIGETSLRCGDCCGLGWLSHKPTEAIGSAQRRETKRRG